MNYNYPVGYSLVKGWDYDQVSVPSNPSLGQTWRERSAVDSKSIVNEWWWNGSIWLNSITQTRQILLVYGQGIIVGGNTGSGISTTTSDHPFSTGNTYNFFLKTITADFKVTGNVSASAYWRLNLKSNATVVQSLNVTAGNNNETTGNIEKTSAVINQLYANTNRYFFNLQPINNPPVASDLSCSAEYQVARP